MAGNEIRYAPKAAKSCIVVPCYNEATRFPKEAFRDHMWRRKANDHHFFFVDDGSTDETLGVLRSLEAECPGQVLVLGLEQNKGKGEAVRRGMLEGCSTGASYVGYWDSDLATPLNSLHEFQEVLESETDMSAVIGTRIRLHGRDIQRSARRHFLGRGFAWLASRAIGISLFDTQCGAKLFRNDEQLRRAIADPFVSRWAFDVELLARLEAVRRKWGLPSLSESLYELPLRQWHDVSGSKIRMHDIAGMAFSVLRIGISYRGRNWPSDAEEATQSL